MIETEAAPQEQGVVEETTSQETQASPKEAPESQVLAPGQVETKESKPQVNFAPRARPSDFVRTRKELYAVKQQLSSQSETLKEMAALVKSLKSPEAESKFDKEVFFADPESVLSQREKRLLGEIENIRKEIGSFKENQTVSERQKNEQDALEMLFPKSPDSDETLDERIEANQDRAAKIMEILKSTGLDEFSQINPKKAAKLALKLLDEKPAPAVGVIPKKLMGGTARGGMGAKDVNQKDTKRAELKRLMDEIDRDESLRFDEKHRERRSQLIRDLERAEKE